MARPRRPQGAGVRERTAPARRHHDDGGAADAAQLEPLLEAGLSDLGLALEPGQRSALVAFVQLLGQWNRVHSLTAVRDTRAMVGRHLLDSLAIVPYVRGPRVLDLGSGAGLPGIPLAIALPDLQFVLLDAAIRKTRFLRHAVAVLRLANVSVAHSRVEQYRPPANFDTLVARAVASSRGMLEAARHLIAPGGRLLAMKGRYPTEELSDLPAWSRAQDVVSYKVPGEPGERHLVVLRPREDESTEP